MFKYFNFWRNKVMFKKYADWCEINNERLLKENKTDSDLD